jgi:hypothetical protein
LTEDERIKPGMSASVSVATDVRTDVLTAPNAAVRNGSLQVLPSVKEPTLEAQTQGIASDTPPESLVVETGLANEQSTEIISGAKEGDWIVVRTITPSAATASANTRTNSLLPAGAGNAVRIQGGGGFTGGTATFRIQQ